MNPVRFLYHILYRILRNLPLTLQHRQDPNGRMLFRRSEGEEDKVAEEDKDR